MSPSGVLATGVAAEGCAAGVDDVPGDSAVRPDLKIFIGPVPNSKCGTKVVAGAHLQWRRQLDRQLVRIEGWAQVGQAGHDGRTPWVGEHTDLKRHPFTETVVEVLGYLDCPRCQLDPERRLSPPFGPRVRVAEESTGNFVQIELNLDLEGGPTLPRCSRVSTSVRVPCVATRAIAPGHIHGDGRRCHDGGRALVAHRRRAPNRGGTTGGGDAEPAGGRHTCHSAPGSKFFRRHCLSSRHAVAIVAPPQWADHHFACLRTTATTTYRRQRNAHDAEDRTDQPCSAQIHPFACSAGSDCSDAWPYRCGHRACLQYVQLPAVWP